MIGKTLNEEYEILSELGAGGYGVVYRAHDTEVNRDVAIKVILPEYVTEEDFKKRFDIEARLVAQLENPHIVPLYRYWQDHQGAFLVMRYIRGGNLRDVLNKHGAMSLSQTLRIAIDIAEALTVAHENNVVHRDLKPENILIDKRGNAYLTDFGIAKRISYEDNITATDAVLGTWAYLSPEQINADSVSPQTDIYAFGIVLYELLAGKHPFGDVSPMKMVMMHVDEETSLPDIHDVRPDLPRALDDIIHKATDKDPQMRYENIQAMIIDLKRILNQSITRQMHVIKPPSEKILTPLERRRRAMIQNVQNFWIEGVLENSLHHTVMIDLDITAKRGTVDNPWDTLIHTTEGDEQLGSESIVDVFERMNGKLLILGEPGSGKTTTLLNLARDLLIRARVDDQYPIPVIFNLSSWSEAQPPLKEWLVEELYSKYQVPDSLGERWVENEELLILLDGLDEVTPAARDSCVQAINEFRDAHGFMDIVICSRTQDYQTLSERLKLKGAIIIQPLDDQQIQQYLANLGDDTIVIRGLIARDDQLHELARSPLMLSIMVLAYRGISDGEIPNFSTIEKHRLHLFETYVERMFGRRTHETPYSKSTTINALGWLATTMRQQAQSVFQIEELQPVVLPPSERKIFYRRVRIIHIAVTIFFWVLQALFLAIGLQLPAEIFVAGFGVMGGAWIGWIFSGNEWQHFSSHFVNGVIHGLASFLAVWSIVSPEEALLYGVLMMFITTMYTNFNARIHKLTGGDKDTIPLIESIRFDWRNIQIRRIPLILTMQSALAIIVLGFFSRSAMVDDVSIMVGFLMVVVITSIYYIALDSIEFNEIPQRLSPNQGIVTTFRVVTIFSLITTIATALLFTGLALLLGLPVWQGAITGLGIGIGTMGYAHWTTLGGIGLYRHWMLRRILKQRGYLPNNLAQFLQYTADLILMRKVGGGYIFTHRYLLEYFADLYSKKAPS